MNHSTSTTPKPTRHPVLLVAHQDGFLEFFGDKSAVEARIVLMPATHSIEAEILAERYVDHALPDRFKAVYFPGNRLDAELIRPITAASIIETRYDLALLRGIQSLSFTEEACPPNAMT